MFVAVVGRQCLLKILSFFFFFFSFLLRFLDFEFVGDLVIVIVVGGGVCGCSGFRCVGFGSLINWLGWDFGPMVVSWLWWWLVEFWATVFVAVVGRQCLLKILSFFFFFFSFLLRFFDLEFVGDPVIVIWAGICCSLWRLICHWW